MVPNTVPPSTEQVHELLRRAFQREIPSGNQIAASAVHKALADHLDDDAWIRENFSDLTDLLYQVEC